MTDRIDILGPQAEPARHCTGLTRRHIGKMASASLIGGITLPAHLVAADQKSVNQAIMEIFGAHDEIKTGRVSLKIPPISENGYSVALDVEVDSPMTASDYVKKIAIVSSRNPIATIAQFQFTPQSGRARLRTYIRLAGTQTVHAIAQMSDGRLWRATSTPLVTVAACVIF